MCFGVRSTSHRKSFIFFVFFVRVFVVLFIMFYFRKLGEKSYSLGVMSGAQRTTVSGSVNLGHAPSTVRTKFKFFNFFTNNNYFNECV